MVKKKNPQLGCHFMDQSSKHFSEKKGGKQVALLLECLGDFTCSNEAEGKFGLRIPPTMWVSSKWIWNHNLVDYVTWTFWNKRRTKCSTLIDGDLCLTHAALETWKYGGLDML